MENCKEDEECVDDESHDVAERSKCERHYLCFSSGSGISPNEFAIWTVTVCLKSCIDPFYIVTYYIKWNLFSIVKTILGQSDVAL